MDLYQGAVQSKEAKPKGWFMKASETDLAEIAELSTRLDVGKSEAVRIAVRYALQQGLRKPQQ